MEEKVRDMGVEEVRIAEMHNIVEGALEKVNPLVAKSYRDYRNYKQDFVQMLDEVYKRVSQLCTSVIRRTVIQTVRSYLQSAV